LRTRHIDTSENISIPQAEAACDRTTNSKDERRLLKDEQSITKDE
jgi:hypothetical protein